MSKVAYTCEQTCPELWVKVPKGLDKVWAKRVSYFDANETAIISLIKAIYRKISYKS
nr:hypothetical protein [Prevotella sp.]